MEIVCALFPQVLFYWQALVHVHTKYMYVELSKIYWDVKAIPNLQVNSITLLATEYGLQSQCDKNGYQTKLWRERNSHFNSIPIMIATIF